MLRNLIMKLFFFLPHHAVHHNWFSIIVVITNTGFKCDFILIPISTMRIWQLKPSHRLLFTRCSLMNKIILPCLACKFYLILANIQSCWLNLIAITVISLKFIWEIGWIICFFRSHMNIKYRAFLLPLLVDFLHSFPSFFDSLLNLSFILWDHKIFFLFVLLLQVFNFSNVDS